MAGSERADRTGAKGDLLKEGASINRSLSALGNVIKALTEGHGHKKGRKGKKHAHIPYRDSMLTRLLSDSLGGTASTLMCCNLAPGSDHYFETLSSLEFAKRVKKVKNTVKLRTEALSQSEAKKMMNDAENVRAEIERMKREHEQQMQASTKQAQSAAHAELESMRKELKRHRAQSVALVQITKATAANDRSILSDEGQRTAKNVTSSDMARLFFVDKRNNRISYLDDDGSEPSFNIGVGLIGKCAQTGEPIIVHDAASDDTFDPSVDESSLTPAGTVKELLIACEVGRWPYNWGHGHWERTRQR